MATTHVLAGLLVGLGLAGLHPEAGTLVALAGAAGGLAPDLDALGAHRKDLHFPVYGWVAAVPPLAVAAWTRHPAAVAGVAFVLAWALHSTSDVLDGGRSLRPWAESVDRAVYCHAQGRWWRPRGVVPYDGAATDLAVAVWLALAALALADAWTLRMLAIGAVALSLPYVAVRRRVPAAADVIAGVDRTWRERVDSDGS